MDIYNTNLPKNLLCRSWKPKLKPTGMQTYYKQVAVTFLILILYKGAFSQDVTTKITLGGSKDEKVQNFQHTQDGGYVIAGITTSNDGDITGFKGVSDMWLVKRKSDLSAEWNICLGTKFEEVGSIVRETKSGDYLVLGLTKSPKGDYDVIIAKVSISGKLLWQKIFGGSAHEYASNLHEYEDGSIMICATTGSNDRDVTGNNGASDVWLLKLTADGSVIWKKPYGGNNRETVQSFEATPDGGAVITTSTMSSSFEGFVGKPYDAWVFKVSSNGILEWNHLLKTSNIEQLLMIKRRPIGDYILAVGAQGNDYDFASTNPLNNIWIVRITNDGEIADKIEFDNGGSDVLRDLIITSSNEVVIAGDYFIGSIPTYTWIFKLDALLQNKKEIFLTSSGVNKPYIIRYTKDAGFIVMEQNIVNNQKDVRLTKLNSELEFVWDKSFGSPGEEALCDCDGWWTKDIWWNKEMPASFFPSDVLEDAQGNYYFAVGTNTNGGDVSGVHMPRKGTPAADIWFVKYTPSTNTPTAKNINYQNVTETITSLNIFPNPARHSITIKFIATEHKDAIIEIFNIKGAKIQSKKLSNLQIGQPCIVQFDISNLPAGNYLYKVQNGNYYGSGKLQKVL